MIELDAARHARRRAGVDRRCRCSSRTCRSSAAGAASRRSASRELEQLVGIVDRLIVDSTEWDDLPGGVRAAGGAVRAVRRLGHRLGAHRALADAARVAVAGDRRRAAAPRPRHARAGLPARGWLRSRLGHEVELEIDERERLEGIDLDGEPAPFPPGDPPNPSDVLSDELDRFAATGSTSRRFARRCGLSDRRRACTRLESDSSQTRV